MKPITQLRQDTYDEAHAMLDKYGECAIIRPTGFGKTGILTHFLKAYKHVLYLYPQDVIRQSVLHFYYGNNITGKIIPNTTFMTYQHLIRLNEETMKVYKDVDLIICDECHKIGATRTSMALQTLREVLPKAKLLGATATPDRMDLKDEIHDFFHDHVVSEYTLHDAFQDGILQRPYYCFCSYGLDDINDVEHETRLEVEQLQSGRDTAEKLLRSRLIEISELAQMDHIIKETCDAHAATTDYMKFIVFFANHSHLKDKGDTVKRWFETAYPTHAVNTMTITSQNKKTHDNIHKLDTLTHQSKTIDLILCCDMMNMGYHTDNLTGIIMYRGTSSGIIFAQQLGRVLSSGNMNAGIVFDVVDNIHRETLYDVLGKESTYTMTRRNRYNQLIAKADTSILTKKEKTELSKLKQCFDQKPKWWTHANDLMPEDLVATGHEATYRELIAKTVAEPRAMRRRQAWAYWIERGGDPSVMTRDAVLAQQSPDAVPLSPFCKLKNVTINEVLEEMGL